jgi:uncharacterized GH25 family protein
MALRYLSTPRTAGVAAIGVELAPKTLTLAGDKIDEYLAEIDAGTETRNAWNAIGAKRKWTESYSKHATTFVRVGDRTTDSSWSNALGFGLEIVPERDPTRLMAGDTLPVRVLRGGAPMSNFAVGAAREGAPHAQFFRTDASGRARIVLPTRGRWLLNGTDLRRSTKPDPVWESDFATMTIRVGARVAR